MGDKTPIYWQGARNSCCYRNGSWFGARIIEGDDLEFVAILHFYPRHVTPILQLVTIRDEEYIPFLGYYHGCISKFPIDPSEERKVCYLAVHESFVEGQG